MMLLPVLL